MALVTLTGILLIVFGGVTDRLIPLFAIGAFLAFTLSQAGMVMHWKRQAGTGSGWRMFVNGLGAVATGITVLVVLVAKFADGAWVTALLIPLLIVMMSAIRRHYRRVRAQIAECAPLTISTLSAPFVVVPMDGWTRIAEKAIRFALKLSDEVQAVHVLDTDEDRDLVGEAWQTNVARPLVGLAKKAPEFVMIDSPYRFVITPLVDHILRLEKEHPDRQIAVLVPEMVVHAWWQNALHNQRSQLLKLLLLLRGNQRIIVINIPWYLES